uniref:Uncharacterized protein n=1 Tax=Aegilops tauschii TaxID=37682 RepID=M8B2B5_AEGTA
MAALGTLVVYRTVFAALGCLMVGTLVYTCITDGSPFRAELLTPYHLSCKKGINLMYLCKHLAVDGDNTD